ncbi:MAG: hypothetical protein AAGA03_09265 [Planctomycetota bacterium]
MKDRHKLLNYWSLERLPFVCDTVDRFYLGIPQRRVIAAVQDWVRSGCHHAQVIAFPGCGLTTLLQYIAQADGVAEQATEFLALNGNHRKLPHQSWDHAFDRSLADAMGFGPLNRSSGPAMIRTANRRALDANRRRGIVNAILIDGSVPPSVLSCHASELVITSSRFRPSKHSSPSVSLHPLSAQETIAYLDRMIMLAGARRELFDQSGKHQIHRKTNGRLKGIALVAQEALRIAACNECRQVEVDHVNQSCNNVLNSRHAA